MTSHPRDAPGVAQIQTSAWCLTRLGAVSPGLLSGRDERASGRALRVACLAERDDVVFVLLEDAARTWSLVWSEATIEVTGTSAGGAAWTVRAQGICERERLPTWAELTWSREAHPAYGGEPLVAPPMGLRLREASMRGYSVELQERTAS